MSKKNKKTKRMSTEEFDDYVLEMSLAILEDEKTNSIVMPYLKTQSADEFLPCLKCIAGLLIVGDADRKKICKEALGKEADFIMMIVRELDRIIAEQVK